MLLKLMKYEFKATGRVILPLYTTLILFSIMNRFFINTGIHNFLKENSFGNLIIAISIFIYGGTMFAIFALTLFIIIRRFKQNLLGDEGYLMHTLPIKTHLNITSKVIPSAIWSILSFIIAIISLIILFSNISDFKFISLDIIESINSLTRNEGFKILGFILELILLSIISLFSFILLIYASISIGHLVKKQKLLCSLLAFIILSVLSGNISDFVFNFVIPDSISNFEGLSNVFIILHTLIVINILFLSIYYIITNYILSKKLNLQ